MKDVIREGNPILKEKSLNVELPLSSEDENTIREMYEYVRDSIDPNLSKLYDLRPAVGIAAPQIGILKKMIAIIAPDEDGNEHTMILINPKLKSYSDELTYLEGGEGCLSVDRVCDAYIHRPARVTFEAYFYDYETRELTLKTKRLKGYLAVVFQHEYDHLLGILFVDKANVSNPHYVPDNSHPIKFNDN
jgi:peptide deformylase